MPRQMTYQTKGVFAIRTPGYRVVGVTPQMVKYYTPPARHMVRGHTAIKRLPRYMIVIVKKLYSYLKLSIGLSFAAFIAGITPDASPTTTATDTDTTTGHILNGTL